MMKFIITAHMVDGTAWETTRHTKQGLDVVVKELIGDDSVEKFTVVEERV